MNQGSIGDDVYGVRRETAGKYRKMLAKLRACSKVLVGLVETGDRNSDGKARHKISLPMLWP